MAESAIETTLVDLAIGLVAYSASSRRSLRSLRTISSGSHLVNSIGNLTYISRAENSFDKGLGKAVGLWNLFLPHEYGRFSPGLTNLEYAPLAELMGRVEWSSELFNCSAPDTGNMEVLAKYGDEAQQERWLRPLLDGTIRSAYLMTEPKVASSDATNIECSIVRDGDEYVINGRKWWSSCVYDPRCQLLLVMGKTRTDGPRHTQQSTIIVPRSTPGVRLVRPLKVFGELHSPNGHGEVALEFMCRRVESRVAFGRKLSEQGSIRENIARSRCEIEQARLLTLAAADKMGREGNKGAKDLISMIKIVAPQMCQNVADRAIQAFGAMDHCQDTPIAAAFAYGRFVRIADGPDEVHMAQLAKWTIAAAMAGAS